MKHMKNIFLAGCTVFLLWGCASQSEVNDLSYQIRLVNQKVEDVRGTTVDQMQKRQAGTVSKIDQVDNQVLQLRTMVEESTFQTSQAREYFKEEGDRLKAAVEALRQEQTQRINALEEKVNALQGALEELKQSRIRDAEKRAREAMRQAEEAKRRTAQSGGVKVRPESRKIKAGGGDASPSVSSGGAGVRPSNSANKEESLFKSAIAQFNNKDYKKAYQTLEKVLANNPKGDLAAQTHFYMGEALFGQQEWDLAILDYQKVISNYPKHRLTPTSLLRQGMSFEKLTDLETAKIIYNRLINEYSHTEEAQTAKTRLQKLK